jgi:hypothetical protein
LFITPLTTPRAAVICGLVPVLNVHLRDESMNQPFLSYVHDVQPLALRSPQSAQQSAAEGWLAS